MNNKCEIDIDRINSLFAALTTNYYRWLEEQQAKNITELEVRIALSRTTSEIMAHLVDNIYPETNSFRL